MAYLIFQKSKPSRFDLRQIIITSHFSSGRVINPSSGPSSAGSASSPLCSPPDSGGWLGYLNTVVSASAISYLPSQVSDTLMQGRAFATVHHNQPGMKNVCALAM